MPRKIKDESGPYDAFDFTQPEGLKDEAIIEIATEFDIPDAVEFLDSFKLWAAIYRNNQAGFRNVATATQRRENAKRIREACESLVELLEDTGVHTIHGLRTLNSDGVQSQFSDQEFVQLGKSGAISRPDNFGRLNLDLEGTVLRLRLMEFSAATLASHMDHVRDNIGNASPIPDMDRRVLINNLRDYVAANLVEKFGRNFEDDFDERVEDLIRVRVPKNPCSKFVFRCAKLIDPTLSGDMIERAMKENIAEANKSVRARLGNSRS